MLEVEPRRLLADVLRQEFVYDAEGQPSTSSFADYLMPGATAVPDIGVHHIVTPSRLTPLGMKGEGEGGVGGVGARAETVAEIGNAVGAALASNKPAIVPIPVRSVLSPYMDYVTR